MTNPPGAVVPVKDGDMTVLRISSLCALFLLVAANCAAGEEYRQSAAPEMFLKVETTSDKFYAGEAIVFDVMLYTSDPNVVDVVSVSPLKLRRGDFSVLNRVPVSRPYEKVMISDRHFFKIPVDCFVGSVTDKGKCIIEGPVYSVAVSRPVIYDDPFWGRMRSSETRKYDVKAADHRFSVTALPDAGSFTSFSGAVGDFEVRTVVPRGDIVVGEDAVAYVIVEGEGFLGEDIMPEYRAAFGTGIRLKSVSPSRKSYMAEGKMMSRITIECTFIPETRDHCEIGPVFFEFFNPESRSYVSAKSGTVPIDVKSSVIRREAIDI